MIIETKLVISIDGEVIYQDTGLGENGLEHILEKSFRIPQQISNYKILHKNMNIPVVDLEAEDLATEIQVEQELLDKADKNKCGKCGSVLVGEDSELETKTCSNCL